MKGSNAHPTELTCFLLTVHAGYLYVSVTHRTLRWVFKCVQAINACVHTLDLGLYSDPKE